MAIITRFPKTQSEQHTLAFVDGYWTNPESKGYYPGGVPYDIIDERRCRSFCTELTSSLNARVSNDSVAPSEDMCVSVVLQPSPFPVTESVELSAIKHEYRFDSGLICRGRLVHVLLINKSGADHTLDPTGRPFALVNPKEEDQYRNYDAFRREVTGLLEQLSSMIPQSLPDFSKYLERKGLAVFLPRDGSAELLRE